MMFNINSITLCTESEGPGKRLAIWFQGCEHNCKGCFNYEMLKIKEKNLLGHKEVFNIIKDAKNEYKIEGITLLGGEPLLQLGLIELLKECQAIGLSVILFTGYIKKEISSELLQQVDILIDGPFIQEKKDFKRPLIGSRNQKIYFLSKRYSKWVTKGSVDINLVDNILIFNGDEIELIR